MLRCTRMIEMLSPSTMKQSIHQLSCSSPLASSFDCVSSMVRSRLPAPLRYVASRHRGFASRSELAERALASKRPFSSMVSDLWNLLEKGLENMRTTNSGFLTKRQDGSDASFLIDCGNGRLFQFTTDEATRQVMLVTPKHGPFYYKYDEMKQMWVGDKDAHFLIELLTRDLIYYAKGFPTF